VSGLIRRDSQQRSAVVTMVLLRSAVGCLVCLLGSVALEYWRFYGDAAREYGHVIETYMRSIKAFYRLIPQFHPDNFFLSLQEMLLAVIFLRLSELRHNMALCKLLCPGF
jgi:hypothetical protein